MPFAMVTSGDHYVSGWRSQALQMARSISHVWRFAACGALIILAAGPVVGIVISLYCWITTGDAAHGIEAITLFTVAGLMGGGGGAVYALVTHSRPKTNWRHYIGFVAAMEAYMAIGSVLILGMAVVAPQLVAGLPATDPSFHLVLHVYGLCLVSLVFAILFSIKRFAGSR